MADAGQSSRSPSCSLQQPEQQGKKIVGLVCRREFSQIIQPAADELRDGALPAKARIVRQVVGAFAPDEGGKKCQDRHDLHGKKSRLRDQRNRFHHERSQFSLMGKMSCGGWLLRRGIAVRRQHRHRRGAGGMDDHGTAGCVSV